MTKTTPDFTNAELLSWIKVELSQCTPSTNPINKLMLEQIYGRLLSLSGINDSQQQTIEELVKKVSTIERKILVIEGAEYGRRSAELSSIRHLIMALYPKDAP